MKIADRVKQAIQTSENLNSQTEEIIKCMEFVRKMESSGVLRTDNQSISPLREGGLEQLKLYALSSIS